MKKLQRCWLWVVFTFRTRVSHLKGYLQLDNSSTDCAKELFKLSKDAASLQVRNEKTFGVLGFS